MKRILCCIICITGLLFTSCQKMLIERREINEIMFVRAMGIDSKTTAEGDGGRYTITITAKQGGQGKQASSEGASPAVNNMSSSGDTMFEAARYFRTFSNMAPFFGHSDYIILGEEISRSDISEPLDFLSRDHEMRLNASVFITRGSTAKSFINNVSTEDIFISDYLESLLKTAPNNSLSRKLELIEIMGALDKKDASVCIPCIQMKEETSKEDGGEGKNITIMELSGYGVIRKNKLIGYILDKQARGYNWIRNFVSSGIINIEDRKGKKIALEIIGANSKIVPVFNDGELSILIDVDVASNIGEYIGHDDIFNNDYLDFLEKQMEEVVKKEIESAIEFAQKNNSDIFGIGETVFRKHPFYWDDIKDEWDKIFPELQFHINVEGNIRRTYIIREHSGTEGQ